MVRYLGPAIGLFLLLTVSQIHGKTGGGEAANLRRWGQWLIAAVDWSICCLPSFSALADDVIHSVFSNQARSSMAVGLGLYWRNVVFCSPLVAMFVSQQVLSFDWGSGVSHAPLAIQEMVFAVGLYRGI